MKILLLTSLVFILPKEKMVLFPKEYSYAILYHYNQGELTSRPDYHIYSNENGFAKSIQFSNDTLNKSKLDSIETLFSKGTHGLIGGFSSCFIPRHGIVYFNENHQSIASVSICFECDRIAFWNEKNNEVRVKEKINIQKGEQIMQELKKLIE
jgi:hypothetical protein